MIKVLHNNVYKGDSMFSKVISGTINGLEASLVNVEVDVNNGIPSFEMSGFLGAQVKESRDRVKIAIKNSGVNLKTQRISVNMSPADIRKDGTGFDLPIAIGILAANGIVSERLLEKTFLIGELSLDGKINSVKGVLPSVCVAKDNNFERCIVPYTNINEGSVVCGIEVYGVRNLNEVIAFLNGEYDLKPINNISFEQFCKKNNDCDNVDFSEIRGQQVAKRASLIAAAGMHNIMYIGAPGSGKTLMAKRISTILPTITFEESLEISKIYSIAGLLDKDNVLITKRPFRHPHHSVTVSALVGGGKIPKPGEITLASKGVLFLDELTEFYMSTIESLRQPLEEKSVTIVRLNAAFTYPADFMLVAAINPCKCGYYPDKNICHCSEYDINRYLGKISQPFWDRFDISVETGKMNYSDLKLTQEEYILENSYMTSKDMKKIVDDAIGFQKERYSGKNIKLNSELTIEEIKRYCQLGIEENKLLERVFTKLNLTTRGYHKILKTARTIADLEQSDNINCIHLSEAISYRSYDNSVRS